jgi:hypothetical protein
MPAMENFAEMRQQAEIACRSRVWTHTVGVVNSIRLVDTDRRIDWEGMGTGCACSSGNPERQARNSSGRKAVRSTHILATVWRRSIPI